MKIMLITARGDHGGGPYSTFKLARELHKLKHEIFVAIPRDKPYFEKVVNTLGSDFVIEIPHRKFSISAVLSIVKVVRANQIQLLHSNGKGAGLYAKVVSMISKVPFIHTPRGIHIHKYGAVKFFLYKFYENIFNNHCKKIVFVSPSESSLAKELRLWSSVNSCVIENGISLALNKIIVKENISNKTVLGDQSKFYVATIARFDISKNMEEALEVASLTQDINYIWIGDGPDRDKLKILINERGLKNIEMIGEVESPIEYLAHCDCYLSTSRWEGLPNSLLEAGLMSLPSVVTNVVGNKDVITDDVNGFLYELGDIQDAAQKIYKIKNNSDLREKLAKNSRSNIENNFSEERNLKKYVNLYEAVII